MRKLGRRARVMGTLQMLFVVLGGLGAIAWAGFMIAMGEGILPAILGAILTLLFVGFFGIQAWMISGFGRHFRRFGRGKREELLPGMTKLKVAFVFELFVWAGTVVPGLIFMAVFGLAAFAGLASLGGGL